MTPQDTTHPSPPQITLERAIALARAGKKPAAAEMLRQVVAAQPLNQAAWLWLSGVTSDRAEAEAALVQAKQINPNHPSLKKAEQWVIHRFSGQAVTRQSPVSETPPPPKPAPSVKPPPPPPAPERPVSRRLFSSINAFAFGLAVLAVIIGLLILFFGLIREVSGATQHRAAAPAPQVEPSSLLHAELDTATNTHNWPVAISILEQLVASRPEDPELEAQLAEAYLNNGVDLRRRGFVEQAKVNFEQALALAPAHPQARREAELAAAYLRGAAHYQAGEWAQAIAQFEQAQAEDATYFNVADLLYSAHYNHGLAEQAAGRLTGARAAFEAASALRPDLDAPRRLLADVEFAMAPGTPLEPTAAVSAANRLIVVGIAEQRMLVFEGDKQVFDFVVSTGEPGRDTATGDFEILNKIDLAYASTWNLDMPYWMGIYWAGPLQNGIHSLPTVKHTGYKLWDGYLGQRVSYGCVILGDEDAKTLYNWTEVGTKVKIVPSLAGWSPDGG
ncbi:MAG: hypothetical protein D6768_13290 [Chloroflexi bacterium]|nr:MAG: hypothetical protein D6768_13290 [Chloroflexota bacterium]